MTTQVTLSLKQSPDLPIEAESLIPEHVAGKDTKEISALPLLVGAKWETVADWFEVDIIEVPDRQGDSADLLLKGDFTRFKRLGQGMSTGSIVVEGQVGFHAGSWMSGGSLAIHGDAGDFLGAHMRGGLIVVHGDAGHYTAAAHRGYTRGMLGGTIVITGSAGQMLGARMRRGLIYVLGDCGDVAGFNMKAGTIVVGGTPGARVGARMVRGSVFLLGGTTTLLPTFSYDCTYQPTVWGVLRKHLAQQGFEPEAAADQSFGRYSGDANEGGKGEVLIRT